MQKIMWAQVSRTQALLFKYTENDHCDGVKWTHLAYDIGQQQAPAAGLLSYQFPSNALICIASLYCFLYGLFYDTNEILCKFQALTE